MHILYVVPNPPSLIRVRPYNLLRALMARGHRITIATVGSSRQESAEIEALRQGGYGVLAASLSKPQIAANLVAALVNGVPLQARYAYVPQLACAIKSLLALHTASTPDIIHIEHLRGAVYAEDIGRGPAASTHRIPIVWDSVDCISYLFRQTARESQSLKSRLTARLELPRTAKYEARLLSRFDHTVVTSEADMAALKELCRSAAGTRGEPRSTPALSVLPNGVDLDYFTPVYGARQAATIVFSGKMSYHANITAALHLAHNIMPFVWAERDDARLVVAGKDPPQEITGLTQRYAGRVSVTGTVPDIRPYLCQATVAAVPIVYGAGVQNKVLEALACATPVVASSKAVSALRVVKQEHLLVADEPADFARAILSLLHDRNLQDCLAIAGRRYVQEYHAWDRIAERLETIYLNVLRRSPAS